MKNKLYNNLKKYVKEGNLNLDKTNIFVALSLCMLGGSLGIIFPPVGINFLLISSILFGVVSILEAVMLYHPNSNKRFGIMSKTLSFVELAIFDTLCAPSILLSKEKDEVVISKDEDNIILNINENIKDVQRENIINPIKEERKINTNKNNSKNDNDFTM